MKVVVASVNASDKPAANWFAQRWRAQGYKVKIKKLQGGRYSVTASRVVKKDFFTKGTKIPRRVLHPK